MDDQVKKLYDKVDIIEEKIMRLETTMNEVSRIGNEITDLRRRVLENGISQKINTLGVEMSVVKDDIKALKVGAGKILISLVTALLIALASFLFDVYSDYSGAKKTIESRSGDARNTDR